MFGEGFRENDIEGVFVSFVLFSFRCRECCIAIIGPEIITIDTDRALLALVSVRVLVQRVFVWRGEGVSGGNTFDGEGLWREWGEGLCSSEECHFQEDSAI